MQFSAKTADLSAAPTMDDASSAALRLLSGWLRYWTRGNMTRAEVKKLLLEREASKAYHEWHRQKVLSGIRQWQQRLKEEAEYGINRAASGRREAMASRDRANRQEEPIYREVD